MLFHTSNGLNATVVILIVYSLVLGTVSVFTGISALEHPDLIIPGPQAGAPEFSYIQSDHFMREKLLSHYQWFNESNITDIINAMQLGNVTQDQLGGLMKFLFQSSSVINYMELLVNRSLLIDDQTVSAVNALLEVKHTVWDYFTRDPDGSPHFWHMNYSIARMEYRNLHELGVLLDRMQDALFSVNLLIGNLPEVEVLPPLN